MTTDLTQTTTVTTAAAADTDPLAGCPIQPGDQVVAHLMPHPGDRPEEVAAGTWTLIGTAYRVPSHPHCLWIGNVLVGRGDRVACSLTSAAVTTPGQPVRIVFGEAR